LECNEEKVRGADKAVREILYDEPKKMAEWEELEHILTFDESIPANRRAIAEARQQLEKMGPVSEV
jgi:hypothetical protein